MDYKTLSEMLYKVVKHPSQWNNQDVKRAGKMEKILQREIEKELSTIGLVAEAGNAIKPEVVSNEVIQTVAQSELKPTSLMERMFAEQDAKLDEEILKNTGNKPAITTAINNTTDDEMKLKQAEARYFVTIICSLVIKKPVFQIFKGDNIVEKDFRTDQITRTDSVFYAVIDASERDIRSTVPEYFINGFITSMVKYDTDWVPPQYKGVWQNRTKIK